MKMKHEAENWVNCSGFVENSLPHPASQGKGDKEPPSYMRQPTPTLHAHTAVQMSTHKHTPRVQDVSKLLSYGLACSLPLYFSLIIILLQLLTVSLPLQNNKLTLRIPKWT